MIRFRPYPLMTVATLVAFTGLIWLGMWQLERGAWKTDMIDRIRDRSTGASLPVDEVAARVAAGTPLEDVEFQRVEATGRFDHAAEVHVFGSVGTGRAGYFVITPLIRARAPSILVNRGFVFATEKAPDDRRAGQVEGEVRITGIVRPPQPPRAFTPKADTRRNIWYRRDLTAMADQAGLRDPLPFYVDADSAAGPPPAPQPAPPARNITNRHFGYALTWFGLSFGLIVVYLVFHAANGRLGFSR